MKQVKLTRVWKGIKETKYGNKPNVAIKCDEYGDRWISTFKVTPEMDSWKEGDTVTINVTEKGGYLNFDTKEDPTSELIGRVEKLEEAVFGEKYTKAEVIKERVVETPDLPDVPLDSFDF